MKISKWKKMLAVGLISGSFLLQTNTTCTDQAQVVTAVSSVITAGGVLYVVDRVLNE